MATIRAYGETARFTRENTYFMDLENRAYFLTATNQRWLSVRLDFLGACLVFAVAVMAANGGGGLAPSQIALCLTYMTTIVQIFGMVGRSGRSLGRSADQTDDETNSRSREQQQVAESVLTVYLTQSECR